jgi:hypothetical protein
VSRKSRSGREVGGFRGAAGGAFADGARAAGMGTDGARAAGAETAGDAGGRSRRAGGVRARGAGGGVGPGCRQRGQGRARCTVPQLTPVRPGRGRRGLRRLMCGRQRAAVAGLAVVAAALAAVAPRADRGADKRTDPPPGPRSQATASIPARSPAAGAHPHTPRDAERVSAPVRVADPATVRLLRPGDRIDVIASRDGTGHARVVASKVRVVRIPESGGSVTGDGALVVLSVPRKTATALADAAAATHLAVTLC